MTESTVFYSIFCITIGLALKRNYILAVAFIGASGMQSQPAGDTALDRYSADAEQAMAAHDWPAAAKALQQLAKGAPGVPEVHANLGLAYYSQNLVSEAAAEFQKTLSLDPKFLRAGWMLGLCDAELGRSEEAIKLLEPAWGHPPDDQAGRLIGLDLLRAYQGLQQYGKAAMLGEDLLRRYPKDPEIVYQVSRLHAGRS